MRGTKRELGDPSSDSGGSSNSSSVASDAEEEVKGSAGMDDEDEVWTDREVRYLSVRILYIILYYYISNPLYVYTYIIFSIQVAAVAAQLLRTLQNPTTSDTDGGSASGDAWAHGGAGGEVDVLHTPGALSVSGTSQLFGMNIQCICLGAWELVAIFCTNYSYLL